MDFFLHKLFFLSIERVTCCHLSRIYMYFLHTYEVHCSNIYQLKVKSEQLAQWHVNTHFRGM